MKPNVETYSEMRAVPHRLSTHPQKTTLYYLNEKTKAY